jgi:hypothetical protein
MISVPSSKTDPFAPVNDMGDLRYSLSGSPKKRQENVPVSFFSLDAQPIGWRNIPPG